MKLPLTVDALYTTILTKEEIMRVVYSEEKETSFLGMKVEEHKGRMVGNEFEVARQASGISAFIEPYPLIKGWTYENPMRIKLKIIPKYFDILFFSICSSAFILGAILSDKMTVNHVYKTPTILERFIFSSFGIVIGIWGYLRAIRPIGRSEKWAVRKFKLTRSNETQ
jgi:hypothetical protein